MKKIFLITATVFLFTASCYAEDIRLKEIEIILQAPQSFQKDKVIEIIPESPLPVYGKATGLCLEVGKPFPAGKSKAAQKAKMKDQLINAFGNLQTQDVYLPMPSVTKVTLTHKDNKESYLTKTMSPAWDFLSQMGIFTENINDNYGRFSVCSWVEGNSSPITKIKIIPIQSFKIESVYWKSSDIIEKTKSPSQ